MESLKYLKLSGSKVWDWIQVVSASKEKTKEEKLECDVWGLKIVVWKQQWLTKFGPTCWINLYANFEMWRTENKTGVPRIILVK